MTRRSPKKHRKETGRTAPVFPFTSIVGQEEMKLALLLNVISPSVGGVLITGHRGTGKSTAVRSLAELLPPIETVEGCPYNCDPHDELSLCESCRATLAAEGDLAIVERTVPVVELPLGATEDRVCGTIDFERALREGSRTFEPGLLARANRGFLYIDEVNLLEDHLVDVLLDVAATGRNRVEREGVSVEHPARFVLVGSSNPEEGELRPQLLDRFGLCVEVTTVLDPECRVRIIEQRESFELDPEAFISSKQKEQAGLRRRLSRASGVFAGVETPRKLLFRIAELCARLGVDGHRGDITLARASRALAALEGRQRTTFEDAQRIATMALRHRLRRDPFERGEGDSRVEREVDDLFRDDTDGDTQGGQNRSSRESRNDATSANDGNTNSKPPSSTAHDGVETKSDRLSADRDTAAPTVEAFMSDDALNAVGDAARKTRGTLKRGRGRSGLKRSSQCSRGRYCGASHHVTTSAMPALDATLRAAAVSLTNRSDRSTNGSYPIAPSDLRYKRFRKRSGTLYIFAVDSSGSMALNRIGQAKGALAHLLRRSYQKRDRVALLSFRGRESELHLAPSNSPARARVLLDALRVGGGTPLSAGLVRALDVARRASVLRERVRLILFTDGRANVASSPATEASPTVLRQLIEDEIYAVGASLKSLGVESVVVDTRCPYTSDKDGRRLACMLGGIYLQLPAIADGRALVDGFRHLTT